MSSRADASDNAERAGPNTSRARGRRRRNMLPYVLALPIVLYELALIIYPIAQGFIGSFQQIELAANSTPKWIGLANYQRMFSDPDFWKVMQTTLIFTSLVIVVAISAGLVTALLFNQPFRFRGAARAMMMMPWAFPEVPVVMIFIWILSPQFGVVNLLVRWMPPNRLFRRYATSSSRTGLKLTQLIRKSLLLKLSPLLKRESQHARHESWCVARALRTWVVCQEN